MSEKLFSTRTVSERYGVHPKTIDRWLVDEDMNFPKPTIINNRRYFPLSQLEQWEKKRATVRSVPHGVAAKTRAAKVAKVAKTKTGRIARTVSP